MCNVSQGIAEDAFYRGIEQGMAQGIEQGMAQGIEQGMAQGIERGIEQTQVDVIKRLMVQLSMSLDEVMKILG